MSIANGWSMIMKREKPKEKGTGVLVEGDWRPGQRCLIIEDVTTSGTSILQTAEVFLSSSLLFVITSWALSI